MSVCQCWRCRQVRASRDPVEGPRVDEDATEIVEAAYERGRQEERAAVVAMLHMDAASLASHGDHGGFADKALLIAARRIENQVHIRAVTEKRNPRDGSPGVSWDGRDDKETGDKSA